MYMVDCLRGDQREGKGKGKDAGGSEEDESTLYVYIWSSIMKPTKP
jgi:hypothetical protein